jgi:hypothetical protein
MQMKKTPLLALLALGLSVAHAHVCYDAFGLKVAQEKLPIESLDESWAQHSKTSDSRLKAGQAHRHLNRAIFPLVGRLHGEVTRLTDHEILARHRQLEESSPIAESIYEFSIPKILPEFREGQTMALVRDNSRAMNFYGPREMGGSAQRFLHVKPNAADVKSMGLMFEQFGLQMTPVSEGYGDHFSRALLRTNQILTRLASERLKGVSAEIQQKNPNLLREETARGKNAINEGGQPEQAPLAILSEGILSFHQLVSAFTIEKVPGAEDGAQAVRGLVFEGAAKSGWASDVTRQLPIGLIGPAALTGRYFKDGLVRNDEGKLELSSRVKALLSQYREANKSRRGVRACPMVSVYLDPSYRYQKTGSPHKEHDVTEKSGVQLIAEAYWRVFGVVYKDVAQRP